MDFSVVVAACRRVVSVRTAAVRLRDVVCPVISGCLGQTAINKQQLSDMLNISKEEQKFISTAKPGMGLLRIGDDIIPVDDSFPKNTQLYTIMTTKPSENTPRSK